MCSGELRMFRLKGDGNFGSSTLQDGCTIIEKLETKGWFIISCDRMALFRCYLLLF